MIFCPRSFAWLPNRLSPCIRRSRPDTHSLRSFRVRPSTPLRTRRQAPFHVRRIAPFRVRRMAAFRVRPSKPLPCSTAAPVVLTV